MTDCDNEIRYDPENKPGVSNLMSILSALEGSSVEEIQRAFDGKGYGVFKDAVADAIISVLEPIQKRFDEISVDKPYLERVMLDGAQRADALATRTMRKVRKKVGLAPTRLVEK